MKLIVFTFVLCVAAGVNLAAQTISTVFSFSGTDGQHPQAELVQGPDGNFYGTAYGSLAGYGGSIFKMTPTGTLTTLYTFCPLGPPCTDGASPEAGLIQAGSGAFYGTTTAGGNYNASCLQGCGTVFKVTGGGKLTTLYSFCAQTPCTDGQQPIAGLIRATNGYLYGTTYLGGASGDGTIFRISPYGKFTTLYSFCSLSTCIDGEFPEAGLVQATDGNLYGTTYLGGSFNSGTIFKFAVSGALTTIYSFCQQTACRDGSEPEMGLIQATDGNLYGTTSSGGATSTSVGTVFKVTTSGSLTTLYSFCARPGCTDGYAPSSLVQATNGDFYGTTPYGGTGNGNGLCNEGSCGTLFQITPSGALTTLYSFCAVAGCPDGWQPYSGLIQDTNGSLYGTTNRGGANGDWGTVYSLSLGLGPFVESKPTSGKAGSAVKIIGANLTGSTSVKFNGTPAFFEVLSGFELEAKVPTSATTGSIQVVTPTGTLTSNVPFQILP